MNDYKNYNGEWLFAVARLLQIKGEPIPEALQKRADKLGLDIRLFRYEKEIQDE